MIGLGSDKNTEYKPQHAWEKWELNNTWKVTRHDTRMFHKPIMCCLSAKEQDQNSWHNNSLCVAYVNALQNLPLLDFQKIFGWRWMHRKLGQAVNVKITGNYRQRPHYFPLDALPHTFQIVMGTCWQELVKAKVNSKWDFELLAISSEKIPDTPKPCR